MAKRAALDIETYNRKRDFTKTGEPKGRKLKGKGDSFVVQKHDASRLHWDFRLELDGVLKSWAVPKGPSLDPGDKRLAMRTEDHPLDYGDFEGTIPKGEYGGGTVMLWDQGRWIPHPDKDPRKTLEEGHLHFTLEGERMKGEWVMFRLKPRPGEKAEPWMLKKVTDEYANAEDGDELVKVIPTNGGDDILMVTKLGQGIRFNEDDVRPMGRVAAGVRGMSAAVSSAGSGPTVRSSARSAAVETDHRSRAARRARASRPEHPAPRRPGLVRLRAGGHDDRRDASSAWRRRRNA